ncbi:MAG: hypothetical protein ABIT01_03720 [Thermoanaerobaculia bacterium]
MSDRNLHDTSASAERVQRMVFARMGGSGRLEAAVEMCEEMRATLESGIRDRQPELDDAGVAKALMALLYGDRLAEAVSPGSSVR